LAWCLSRSEKISVNWLRKLTFDFDHEFNEAFLVVALSDDIHEDVVLLPHAINLVVLVLNDGASAVPYNGLLHEFLLTVVTLVVTNESRP
jgi:hypothetical protein